MKIWNGEWNGQLQIFKRGGRGKVWETLPTVNAVLNATSAVFLVTGYRWIRQKEVLRHRAMMISACVTSAVFLLSYTIYHWHHGTTRFPGEGAIRTVYLAVLGTHTLLAMLVPPMAIWAVLLAHRGRFQSHRAVARWLFPVWLYVSVTGVLVYLMLYHLKV